MKTLRENRRQSPTSICYSCSGRPRGQDHALRLADPGPRLVAGFGLPVKVSAGRVDFDLAESFFFDGDTIQSLTISDPEGFSERPLLAAKGLSAQVALLLAVPGPHRRVAFHCSRCPQIFDQARCPRPPERRSAARRLVEGAKPEPAAEPPSDTEQLSPSRVCCYDSGRSNTRSSSIHPPCRCATSICRCQTFPPAAPARSRSMPSGSTAVPFDAGV